MKVTAYIYVVIAAALWGTIGIYSKHLQASGFTIFQIVSVRAIFAAFAILLYILIKDRKLLRIEARECIYFVGTGIISFVFFNWCYFIAISKTSLSVAAVLLYTAPVFVMLLSSILFGEKLTVRKITSLFLTFAGCALVSAFAKGTERDVSFMGILAGLGSGLGYALYSIFGRYALRKYRPVTVTFYTFVFACIGLIPMSNIKGMLSLFVSIDTFCHAILLGLFVTVLPFLLYTKGLTFLETGKASIIATLEPVVATVVGILMFGEPITLFKTIGILIVIIAVSILAEKEAEKAEEQSM